MSTPAYELGRIAGAYKRGVEQMFQQISKGLDDAYREARRPRTLEEREAASIRRYRSRIKTQRALARDHLRAEVRRVRADLGLPDDGRWDS